MLHVLTTFDLKPGIAIEAFQAMLEKFEAELKCLDLVVDLGQVGRRHRNTIMDTDDERDQEYFFLMTFRDRAQCDRAIALMQDRKPSATTVHQTVYAMVEQPIFSCWEDI